jgi:putative photosynthetic complex assembly protein
MSDPFRDRPLPSGPILGAAIVVGIALLAVAAARTLGVSPKQADDAAAVAVRELRFVDRADGSISVLDARGGGEIVSVAPGTNGFLRGTMRGLARERRRQDIGPEAPFRLIARADGRLTLFDPATGRRVDLESFGPTNAEVFAQFLPAAGNAR